MKHPLEGMENAFIPAGQHLSRASLAKMSPEQSRILRRVHLGRPPYGLLPEPDMVSTLHFYQAMQAEYECSGFFVHSQWTSFDNPDAVCTLRFFKNKQWAKPVGPIFLMIGGESPRHPRWVVNENLTYLKWAKTFGATVYLLEHRYYGESNLIGYESI
ncbi:hypothetical protein OSTOST_17035, partial [Ostertagia ostertagi]